MNVPSASVRELIGRIEMSIRRDPGRRGLIGADGEGPGLGGLLPAATQLAAVTGNVCLMTGFFIPESGDSRTPGSGNAETDGPPGTTLLAAVLLELGYSVQIVTDENCSEVVRSAVRATDLEAEIVLESPLEATQWRREFLASEHGSQLSHLIAIERVGPGHTTETVRQQDSSEHVEAFESLVPESEQNRCRNMRGEAIDHFTGDLHGLFDDVAAQRVRSQEQSNGSPVQTIGVGDGGNEIGMGLFRWSELHQRLSGPQSGHVPCRVATDRAVVAGTSNWGAMALAAAVCVVRDRVDLLDRHTVAAHQDVVRAMVADAGAVDGVTRRREATVDGLPFLTYAQPWSAIRRLLGLTD